MIDQILSLEMTTYLQNETEFLPWDSAINNLAHIEGMLSKTGLYGLFEVRDLYNLKISLHIPFVTFF